MTIRRGASPLRKAIAFLLGIFLALVIAEASSRVLWSRAGLFGPNVFDGSIADGSVLALKRNYHKKWITDEFDIWVHTNSDGFRENADFQLDDVDVAFFGDSFTFGNGVEAEERYSSIFGRHFPTKLVVSLGYAAGFQPEHYEYFFNHHPLLAPQLCVVGLYLGNDLETDVRETVTRKNAQGEIIDAGLPNGGVFEGWLVNTAKQQVASFSWAARHSYFARLVLSRLNRSGLREYLFAQADTAPNAYNSASTERGDFGDLQHRALDSLLRLDNVVRKRKGRLIVLIIPQNYFVSDTGQLHLRPELRADIPSLRAGPNMITAVKKFCRDVQMECVDSVQVLKAADYFANDAHWNASGHFKAGELLARYVGPSIEQGR